MRLGLGDNPGKIMIGGIMLLIPGIALAISLGFVVVAVLNKYLNRFLAGRKK